MLLLIDGSNLLRTVYEANPAPDSLAKVDGGFKAALGSFRRALDEHAPDYAVAAFDAGGSTWRHEIYPEYKADRKPMYAGLRERLPEFYHSLAELGLRSIAIPGVEAEDVLATVNARWMERKQGPVVALSNDKDVAATLTLTGAMVYDHFKKVWHDRIWIESKFGVVPERLLDYLALVGDKTDGIPGAKGIGEKTAPKLLQQFGDLEGVLRNAPLIPGRVGQNLQSSAHMVRLSRQLVSLKTDVKLGISWNMIAMPKVPASALPKENNVAERARRPAP